MTERSAAVEAARAEMVNAYVNHSTCGGCDLGPFYAALDAYAAAIREEQTPASVGELDVLQAAHHAYCTDTGCFDGDDISVSPEVMVMIRAYGAACRAEGQGEAWCVAYTDGRHSFHPEDHICACGLKKAGRA